MIGNFLHGIPCSLTLGAGLGVKFVIPVPKNWWGTLKIILSGAFRRTLCPQLQICVGVYGHDLTTPTFTRTWRDPPTRLISGLQPRTKTGPPTYAHGVWEAATKFCMVIKLDETKFLHRVNYALSTADNFCYECWRATCLRQLTCLLLFAFGILYKHVV